MSGDTAVVARIPECNICGSVPAAVDAKTRQGPWAFMCDACFVRYGVGLGTGRGQRLILASDAADAAGAAP